MTADEICELIEELRFESRLTCIGDRQARSAIACGKAADALDALLPIVEELAKRDQVEDPRVWGCKLILRAREVLKP